MARNFHPRYWVNFNLAKEVADARRKIYIDAAKRNLYEYDHLPWWRIARKREALRGVQFYVRAL